MGLFYLRGQCKKESSWPVLHQGKVQKGVLLLACSTSGSNVRSSYIAYSTSGGQCKREFFVLFYIGKQDKGEFFCWPVLHKRTLQEGVLVSVCSTSKAVQE